MCSRNRYIMQALFVAEMDSDRKNVLLYQSGMLSEWLQLSLKGARISQTELARRLTLALGRSIDRAAVNKMTKNKRKIAADELLAIEGIIGMQAPREGLELTVVSESPNAIVGPKVAVARNKIPAYGQAVAGLDGEFIMNGNLIAYLDAPAGLDESKGAYAVFVAGDSMEPRYYDGETVYVDPTKRPMRGKFVVAQILSKEGEPPLAYIKRFIRHNAEELVLSQFNPVKELTFPSGRVVSVHVIVMGGS